MPNLKDYLNQIENITDKVVSDNCFNHETVDVLEGLVQIKTKINEITNLISSGLFKGDKGDKGDPGEPGKPGTASLAIDDNNISSASTWSSEKLNTLNYQSENEIITDRAFNIETKNGVLEVLKIEGKSMVIGGEMTSVSNGKGLTITTYNGTREDVKQLLYFDPTENQWKKIKMLCGNDEIYDSIEYDVNTDESKLIRRCKIEGSTVVPIEPIVEYKANSLNLNTYDPNTSLKMNTTLFPKIHFHVHTRIHDNVLKNKERISNLEGGLQKIAGRGSIISDDEISQRKTWSSKKIDSIVNGKPVAPPPISKVMNTHDIHLNKTSNGLINSFTIDGKTLTNTIAKSNDLLTSDGSGLGNKEGRMITPRVKMDAHDQITVLVRCTKSSPEIDARLGGSYIDEIILEDGLKSYVTTVNMKNGVITPYIKNTFVSSDNVRIEVLNVVQGVVNDLTEFDGMKSVGLDNGLYIESIKADGNIFNGYLKPGTIDNNGVEQSADNNVISAFIFVQPGVKYSWSTFAQYLGMIYEYDEKKNFIGITHLTHNTSSATFTGTYIRLKFVSKDTKLLFMLNEGEVKQYEPPIFNRTTVLYKKDGVWTQIKELQGVNGVKDAIVKHPDNKYYLHERTMKKNSRDLVRPIKSVTGYSSKDVYFLDITNDRLGEEVGDDDDILIQCDKLNPVTANEIISIEHDDPDCIAYSPTALKVYISIPKGTDVNNYLQTKNFNFIFPSVEEIYEVNPLYVRSYYPKTNLSIRGTSIIPQVEFKIETNIQEIAKENLIRLQQLESEVFKSNVLTSINRMLDLENRLKRMENDLFENEYIKSSHTGSLNLSNVNNVKLTKLQGKSVNDNGLKSVGSSVNRVEISDNIISFKDIGGNWKPITELRSADTIYDTIELHDDGKYYYHQRTGTKIFTGDESEDWLRLESVDTEKTERYGIYINDVYVNGKMLSDRFKYSYQGNDERETCIYIHNTVNRIDIKRLKTDDRWTDLTSFKKWLQSNNLTVIYQLSKEKVFEVNDIILKTHNNETNITVEGDIKPSYIEVKAYESLKYKVQSIEDMVKNNPITLEEEII